MVGGKYLLLKTVIFHAILGISRRLFLFAAGKNPDCCILNELHWTRVTSNRGGGTNGDAAMRCTQKHESSYLNLWRIKNVKAERKNAVKEEWGWRGHQGKASRLFTDSKKGINYQSQQILSLMFLKVFLSLCVLPRPHSKSTWRNRELREKATKISDDAGKAINRRCVSPGGSLAEGSRLGCWHVTFCQECRK